MKRSKLVALWTLIAVLASACGGGGGGGDADADGVLYDWESPSLGAFSAP
jgi:hypothetical protein